MYPKMVLSYQGPYTLHDIYIYIHIYISLHVKYLHSHSHGMSIKSDDTSIEPPGPSHRVGAHHVPPDAPQGHPVVQEQCETPVPAALAAADGDLPALGMDGDLCWMLWDS